MSTTQARAAITTARTAMPRSKSYKISTKTYEKEQDSISFRLAVLGSGAVGKSALTIRFTNQKYVEHYDPTIEDTYRVQSKVDEKGCVLEILDTAGQDEFSSMQDQWMRDGKGFLLVYNITDRSSFDNVTSLYRKILRTKDADSAPVVIAGNKCDLDNERAVSKEEGQALANEWSCPFYETSAKEKIQNEECFYALVREIRRRDEGSAAERDNKKPPRRKFCAIV